jgi:hypothetical protein
MKVTVSVTVNGTEPFEGVYLLDSNGKRLKEIWKSTWTYSRKNNTSTVSYTTNLRAGEYYLKQWDIYRNNERVRFTTRVNAQLTGKATLKSVKKVSGKAAKLTWNKISGVNGYEVYRSTSKNGTYTKVKSVASSKTAFQNTGLKKKCTYYYKVRGYKKISGKTYYTPFSAVKKIKM